MKKTLFVAVSIVLLALLSSCGSTAPGNPDDNCSYGFLHDVTPGSEWTEDYITVNPIEPESDITVNRFRINMVGAGRIVGVIYADDSGEPGALLARTDVVKIDSARWITINIPGVLLQDGEKYWIGAVSDSSTISTLDNSLAEDCRYYLTTWPGADVVLPGAGASWSDYHASNQVYVSGKCNP